MSTAYTGYDAATILALDGDAACVQFRGKVPSCHSEPYETVGKYTLDPEKNMVFFNMTLETLTIGNLPRCANVHDPISKTVMKHTSKGGTLNIPPCKHMHWKTRANDCVDLSKAHQAKGTLIFILDIGTSDELFDPTIEVNLTQMAEAYMVVLQDGNAEVFDLQCTKRQRTEYEKEAFTDKFFGHRPDSSVIVEVSPPLDTVRELTHYFNTLFGAHKRNIGSTSVTLEHTLILPKEFKLTHESRKLMDSDSVVNGSVEIGMNTNSILFKMAPCISEKNWSVTVVGLRNAALPFTTQLVPHGSEMLKKLVCAAKCEKDVQVIYDMMEMSVSHRSAFERAPDLQRLWNSVIEHGNAKWFAARAGHDNNANLPIGIPNPPHYYARMASNMQV